MMKKFLSFATLAVFSGIVHAETATPDNGPKLVLGRVNEGIYANNSMPATCGSGYQKRLDGGEPVIISGSTTCRPYSGAELGFWTIAVNGKEYMIRKSDVVVSEAKTKMIEQMSPDEAQRFHDNAIETSTYVYRERAREALGQLRATKPSGLAIIDSGIYDESEYTEGTSFRVKVFNPTSKPIKYVWFTLIGYNAVDDVVRSRGQSSLTMRGIGPVEAEGIAAWSFKYVWLTDIVESYRISQVKVQYMDNSTKVIAKPSAITINEAAYRLLFEEGDD